MNFWRWTCETCILHFCFQLQWSFRTLCCTLLQGTLRVILCGKPWSIPSLPHATEDGVAQRGGRLCPTQDQQKNPFPSHKEMCLKNVHVISSGNVPQQTLLKQLWLSSILSLCRSGKSWHSVWPQLTSEKLEVGQMHAEFLNKPLVMATREAKSYKLLSGGTG